MVTGLGEWVGGDERVLQPCHLDSCIDRVPRGCY